MSLIAKRASAIGAKVTSRFVAPSARRVSKGGITKKSTSSLSRSIRSAGSSGISSVPLNGLVRPVVRLRGALVARSPA
jgi:hypothetical protein